MLVFISGEFRENLASLSRQFAAKRESPIRVLQKRLACHPRAQRNDFRRCDARPQSRLSARWNPRLRRSPSSNRLCSDWATQGATKLQPSGRASQWLVWRLVVSGSGCSGAPKSRRAWSTRLTAIPRRSWERLTITTTPRSTLSVIVSGTLPSVRNSKLQSRICGMSVG
jgi:hypothetical protein